MADGIHQGESIYSGGVIPGGLMPLQADITVPQSTSLASGTGMLVADTSVMEQLRHFPEEVYDLRPTSHLVRLMQALLGDAGVGQLRKRLLLSQLQSLSASGARFFDLDRFYGALFGATRNDAEQLPLNPMETATATAAEWESIESADSSFRDRMTALAQSIAQGGTVPGLKAAAEAITGCEVDVFESWALLDAVEDPEEAGHTWGWMEGGLWSEYEGQIWGALEGGAFFGRSGSLTRSELLVRVNRDYPSTVEGRAQRTSDEWALVRVLERLRPAHILLTLDTQGSSALLPRAISAVRADSEHWEIASRVTPGQIPQGSTLYPLSVSQEREGVAQGDARILPRPPLVTRIGDEWSYDSQMPTCRSYASMPTDDVDFTEPGPVNDLVNDQLDQVIVWRDGTSTLYGASLGSMDPMLAQSARAGSDGVLVANPYSGDRRTVLTTD
ncbi:hypothetical protein E6R60_26195 [Streptomyces sp. A0642]|uniref:DUF7297 family protein n=1 Tax=Streptomyces sp. A0642 TaxID=2563100 RepID=UPI0010A28974|nr:hypothetical protein [Streptomyces sp. A0642]THA72428.1 hypothetical protein E6R60_26195 [Streptomyces sp. A0642]